MSDDTIAALARQLGVLLGERKLMCAISPSHARVAWSRGPSTDIAGSSGWFDRGFVTYSNEAKMEMLGVPEATLAQHGAVSEPTARAMAEGALRAAARTSRSPSPAWRARAEARRRSRSAWCASRGECATRRPASSRANWAGIVGTCARRPWSRRSRACSRQPGVSARYCRKRGAPGGAGVSGVAGHVGGAR